VIGDSSVKIAFLAQRDTAIVVSRSKSWIYFDGFVVIGDGSVKITFVIPCKAAIAIS